MQIYRDLQRVGVCQCFAQKDVLLNDIGGRHFNDTVLKRVQDGGKFQIIGDNFDLRVVRSDMRKDARNLDLHYLASTIVFDRINFNYLPDDKAKMSLEVRPVTSFVTNHDKVKELKRAYKVLIACEIVESCPALN